MGVCDLVLVHGVIYTFDVPPTVTTIGVVDGRVAALGDDALACDGPRTDLGGAVVFPGFTDAHAHPIEAGLGEQLVVLGEAATPDDVLQAVRDWLSANPRARWVVGTGWDAARLDGWSPIEALDAIDRPVFLASADGHSAWVNHAALARARLREAPPGGRLERRDGALTGTIRETAVDVVSEVIPRPTRAAYDRAAVSALRSLARYGITTVVDAAADRHSLGAWRRADPTVWVGAAVVVEPAAGLAGVRRAVHLRRRYPQVTAIKLYLDGVIESRTARLVDPYTDGTNGEILWTDPDLEAVLRAADAGGLQVHVHAIGDGAVRQLLDAVERVGPLSRPVLAAHLELVDPLDLARFARLGVVADLQPYWAWPDPYVTDLTVPVVGAARGARLYPFASLEDAGATLVAGSDWDVTTLDPWPAIEVAHTRTDPDRSGLPLAADEALPLASILTAYTVNGARAVRGEGGTLSVGAPADFVVLDRDPFQIPAQELSEVTVTQTWFKGRRLP